MSVPRGARGGAAGVLAAAWLSLLACVSTHAASVTYEHDGRGRLIKATYDDGTVVDYNYDANGNRLAATVSTVAPDTTAPSAPGPPSFSNVAMTSATASWTAASDNVGVAGYEYRLNAGSWQAIGHVLTIQLSGLSAGSAYPFEVRAKMRRATPVRRAPALSRPATPRRRAPRAGSAPRHRTPPP